MQFTFLILHAHKTVIDHFVTICLFGESEGLRLLAVLYLFGLDITLNCVDCSSPLKSSVVVTRIGHFTLHHEDARLGFARHGSRVYAALFYR